MELGVKYVFELMQDNIELAVYEVEQLLGCALQELFPGVYTTPQAFNESLLTRLAYTKQVCKVIESQETLKAFTNPLSTESFKVQFLSKNTLTDSEKSAFFDVVHALTNEAKVKMTKPEHIYTFVVTESILLTETIFTNDKSYWERTPNKRPCFHPTSMSPKVAKAMINIVGPDVTTIHDPFCGTGGLLIESLHNGVSFIGSDIDPEMLASAQKNVSADIAQNSELAKLDQTFELISALKITHKSDAILSDVPYGKNTKSVGDIDTLYTAFLRHAAKNKLASQIVLCIPDSSKLVSLAESCGWSVKKEITEYVHKSLTRHIVHFIR